ncbi:MAG: alpha/beta-type small acid-soluble spore protein [Defluviitaleaceae bacterium]|nr:alpha/beta-type small acid-soluble spore protein [Defluviitaleaceae bacterium]
MSEKKPKVLTENDLMKLEIAEELGLMDKVKATGWKSLTAKESGRIGGIMTKRKKEAKRG